MSQTSLRDGRPRSNYFRSPGKASIGTARYTRTSRLNADDFNQLGYGVGALFESGLFLGREFDFDDLLQAFGAEFAWHTDEKVLDPVLALEVARKPHSLNLPMREGKAFYSVLFLCAAVAAGIVLIPGLPLVYVVLIVNVIAVLAMPPALIFLFMLANDREVVGNLVTPPLIRVLATGVVILLVTAGVLFGVSVIAPGILQYLIVSI